ncbi:MULTISPECIES: GNAT family N-acetyltransferase [unclassified Streptomyces]|uniref:GNAT family N-acetyltransferase n=1 Tax=unclassified Streptomyces TaxID=2593676 RepID=UPI0004ABC0F9|nr:MULTISPECIES: GNAT family N-acetyltransferase [unclassified Streptomyces]APU42014.1 GNAT family N-acetyltransferase [Streptomyces sp. TN58]KJK48401.1 acetyltransferase [Streptomyces sp. NRRL F-4428]
MTITVRPAGPGDATDICALLNAVDMIEIGRPETDLATVEADLNAPDVDLATDSWLAFEDGRLLAYALVWADSGPGRVDGDHYVLPGHHEAATLLLERMEARAREITGAAGTLKIQLNVKPTIDLGLLADRGYRTVRRYQVMTRPLSAAADPAPTPPAGLVLRHCGDDEADRHRAHALVEETFAAHFGHVDRPYETWLDHIEGRALDWSLVWIASLPGEGDVAVLLTRDDRTSMAWISHIGVRQDVRGRGVGGFLLRHGFAAYAARGRDTIGLGVDTLNATGALALYEAHGMALHYGVDAWELALHPQG